MGHHHRDETYATRVTKACDEVLGRQQRDLAVRDLCVPFRSEPRPELVELAKRAFDGERTDPIGFSAEVAGPACKVAPWMDANRRATPGRLPSEALSRRAPPRVERLPPLTHQPLLLLGHRLSEKTKGSEGSRVHRPFSDQS